MVGARRAAGAACAKGIGPNDDAKVKWSRTAPPAAATRSAAAERDDFMGDSYPRAGMPGRFVWVPPWAKCAGKVSGCGWRVPIGRIVLAEN